MGVHIPKYREGRDYIIVEMGDRFRFKCQRCGNCCNHPPILQPEELGTVAEFMHMGRQEFSDAYCHPYIYTGMVRLNRKTNSNKCTFYMHMGRGRCTIYEAKPGDCEITPLKGRSKFTGLMDDLFHPERLSLSICTGYGHGKEISIAEFAERTGIVEHLAIDRDIITGFIDFLGGSEAAEHMLDNLPVPGSAEWKGIIGFIEKLYGVKIIC